MPSILSCPAPGCDGASALRRGTLRVRESKSGGPSPGSGALPAPAPDDALASDRRWVCKACRGFVADGRARIEVNGSHTHSFINPAGLIFAVGCFGAAPGLRALGAASRHWTWFPGFEWQVGVCQSCFEHLGWSYHDGATGFVALRLDQIIERGEPGD